MIRQPKIAATLRALELRRERIARTPSGKRRMAHVLAFLENEIWPNVPRNLRGRGVSRMEREEILGYGKCGV